MNQAVEICIDCDDKMQLQKNIEKVYQAGAQRVELCSVMSEDGLTPDLDSIKIARKAFADRRGVLVMIRPRAGDFYYQQQDIFVMLDQIKVAAAAGADGVVFGVLKKQCSNLHFPAMKLLVKRCQDLNLQVTCHRAFDAVADREQALKQLIELGVDRVLTSGTSWHESSSALNGVQTLVDTMRKAKSKIEIVIAGGVNPDNGKKIFDIVKNDPGKYSFHAFSSVLEQGEINTSTVKQLVAIN